MGDRSHCWGCAQTEPPVPAPWHGVSLYSFSQQLDTCQDSLEDNYTFPFLSAWACDFDPLLRIFSSPSSALGSFFFLIWAFPPVFPPFQGLSWHAPHHLCPPLSFPFAHGSNHPASLLLVLFFSFPHISTSLPCTSCPSLCGLPHLLQLSLKANASHRGTRKQTLKASSEVCNEMSSTCTSRMPHSEPRQITHNYL